MNRHPMLRVDVTVTDIRAIVAAVLDAKIDVGVVELSLVESERASRPSACPSIRRSSIVAPAIRFSRGRRRPWSAPSSFPTRGREWCRA